MVKRHKLATRGFGSECGVPDIPALAAWIAGHRGTTADITTYRLDQSLSPQIEAGIMTPCAGGKFYADRILASLCCVEDRKATGELHVESAAIIEDAARIVVGQKGAWCAMPAPHLLKIVDEYYYDESEWSTAICGAYRTIMRSMRDSGIAGTILICETMDDEEMVSLTKQKVFFFQPEPDRENLARLMTHQRQIAVRKTHLKTVFSLTDEYPLQKIFIIDPDPVSVQLALSQLDPDQVVAGGYCLKDCSEYWKPLAENAVYWN